MSSKTEGSLFNHDLLVNPSDLALVDKKYGVIKHVLIDKKLQERFNHYNDLANYAKNLAQKTGFVAIAFIYFALTLAALELLKSKERGLALAVFAISSVLGGVLIGVVDLFRHRNFRWRRTKRYAQRIGVLAIVVVTYAVFTYFGESLFLLVPLALILVVGWVVFGVALFSHRNFRWRRAQRYALATALLLISGVICVGVPAYFKHWQVCIPAAFGLIGCIIGDMGVLRGPRKEEWLHNRLMTERIRQFHFQTFVSLIPQFLRGTTEFETARKECWDRFCGDYGCGEDDGKDEKLRDMKLEAEFKKTIKGKTGPWLLNHRKPPAKIEENKDLDLLFKAYGELRIQHQMHYAGHKLRTGLRSFLVSPPAQAKVLWQISLVCIAVIVLIHLGVLVAIELQSVPFLNQLLSKISSTPVVLFAITALAARAIEQGLQPEREKERYQQYRWALEDIRRRFDITRSKTATGNVYQEPPETLRIMEEMERLSYREMRDFLICGDDAQFVM